MSTHISYCVKLSHTLTHFEEISEFHRIVCVGVSQLHELFLKIHLSKTATHVVSANYETVSKTCMGRTLFIESNLTNHFFYIYNTHLIT